MSESREHESNEGKTNADAHHHHEMCIKSSFFLAFMEASLLGLKRRENMFTGRKSIDD